MAYNGHPSWALWNVSLWFANDEGLYRLALDALAEHGRLDEAVDSVQELLAESAPDRLPDGAACTPDGARYSKSAIRHALRGLRE